MTVVDTGRTRVTGRRIVQYIVDVFLAGVVLSLLGLLVDALAPGSGIRSVSGSLTELNSLTAPSGWPSVVAVLLTIAVWATVFIVLPSRNGRTPGMALLGLRIVDVHGGRASAGQHVGRAVLLILDMIFAGLVGWIVILCSQNRQRIGDHAAGTLVVRS
ncbi:MAG: RDD family protein [Pseudonocardia sp.]|nr:RDD family protein [Pseudonocardia sp.]